MKHTMYIVDAFTDTLFKGNPAAVIVLEEWLSDELMQAIEKYAADISEITITLADNPYVVDLKGIQNMAKETMEMIIKSIEAFVNKDLEIANEVIRHDDVVDDLFKEIKKTVIKLINENTGNKQ